MSITVPPEWDRFIAEQIQSGRYHNASQVIVAALQAMEEESVKAPMFPPGSLSHLYTVEANAEEAKIAAASSLKVEGW